LALASSLVLFMGGVGVPAAGFILLPLVPQPALALAFRQGFAWAALVLLAVSVVLALTVGRELVYIYGVFAVATALLLTLLGRLRAIEFLVTTVAAVVFAGVSALMLYLFGSWNAMVTDTRASLLQHMMAALDAYEKMGVSKEGFDGLREQIPRLAESLLQLLPALVFLSLAFMVLINVLLLCRRFPEKRAEWFGDVKLREWKCPEPLVWGLIACGFALFVPGLELLDALALNLLLVIGACYFAQGIAVIAFFFDKNKVPLFLRGITYALIVLQQILTLLVVGLGLFDLWGDFRRLRKNNLRPSQAS
jgi:uncharacterized protein YybS (DUF2232 family)